MTTHTKPPDVKIGFPQRTLTPNFEGVTFRVKRENPPQNRLILSHITLTEGFQGCLSHCEPNSRFVLMNSDIFGQEYRKNRIECKTDPNLVLSFLYSCPKKLNEL